MSEQTGISRRQFLAESAAGVATLSLGLSLLGCRPAGQAAAQPAPPVAYGGVGDLWRQRDRKSTRLNSSHMSESRMPSSA